jgi:hypothetical protein
MTWYSTRRDDYSDAEHSKRGRSRAIATAAPSTSRDRIDVMTDERIETSRHINAEPAAVFALLADPKGHVAIDSSGMLQSATGEAAKAVGDSFVIHMDRESLNDFPDLGKYDVTVVFRTYEQDRELAWDVTGRLNLGHFYGYKIEPADGGSLVTSYYDWSEIEDQWRDANIFPVMSEGALRATLGILARTVEH